LTAFSATEPRTFDQFARAESGLDASARGTQLAGNPVSINAEAAKSALSAAISDARAILATLDALQAAVAGAASSSISGGSVQLDVGGTRISRVNIQTEIRRALADINALVTASARGGVNFIASNARAIEVQTTRFGGSVTLAPQPLDSEGLGFGAPSLSGRVLGFTSLSDAEVTRAQGTLAQARELASRRLQTLQAMEDRLAFSSAAAQAVRTLDTSARLTLFARGSVVDLFA
jgi:hypothetical protein